MVLAGQTVYLNWRYKPITIMPIKWLKDASGTWVNSDRGSDQDIYMSDITLYGSTSDIDDITLMLSGEMEEFAASFSEGEEIFGAEVDHTSGYQVTIVNYGKLKRINYAQYAYPIRLRLVEAPSFLATLSPSLNSLRLAEWQWEPDVRYRISKSFTYDKSATYLDEENQSSRYFSALFRQTHEEMGNIRRYITQTARGNQIDFPYDIGVDEPFQWGSSYVYARIKKWIDLGRINPNEWLLQMEFVRD